MEYIFTEQSLNEDTPIFNEKTYLKYNIKITPENFVKIYNKSIEIIEKNENPIYNIYKGVTYILNPKYPYPVELPLNVYNKTIREEINVIHMKQGIFYKKLAKINDLQINHKIELTSKKRSLEEQDLMNYFSWKPNIIIIPELFNCDCIGIPGLNLYQEDHFYHIKTCYQKGIMIPIYSIDGNIYKYQLKSELIKGSVKLKARTKDGFSVMHSEYFDNNIYYLGDEYKFIKSNFTGIEIENINTNEILNVELGQDVTNYFPNRPKIIDKIKVEMKAKYKWLPKASMIKDDINTKAMTHTENIFLQNKKGDNNILIITEGILKAHIINKHFSNHNIIVAATPGIAKSMLNSLVQDIFKLSNIKEVLIAYDNDAYKNRLVNDAISYLFQKLRNHFNTKVITWDKEYKGLDDYLINNKNRKFIYGTPNQIYPIQESEYPYPYHITGKRAKNFEWIEELKNQEKEK